MDIKNDDAICAGSDDAGADRQQRLLQAVDVTWELPSGAMATEEDIPSEQQPN